MSNVTAQQIAEHFDMLRSHIAKLDRDIGRDLPPMLVSHNTIVLINGGPRRADAAGNETHYVTVGAMDATIYTEQTAGQIVEQLRAEGLDAEAVNRKQYLQEERDMLAGALDRALARHADRVADVKVAG